MRRLEYLRTVTPAPRRRYEGEGRLKFPSGVEYVGQFHKGEFHGEGALVYPNGGRYQAPPRGLLPMG